MYVIVGLGNPGKKYESTRHNIGFEVVDYIAREQKLKPDKLKHKALYCDVNLWGERVMLVKPQTYMNLSGDSVISIVNYFKADLNKLLVIYDDIDIPLGDIRIRKSGSSGTHNGMKDIIYKLKSDEFPRIRLGVGKNRDIDLKDFVLTGFSGEEIKIMENSIIKAADAVACFVRYGIDRAMNDFNSRKKNDGEQHT